MTVAITRTEHTATALRRHAACSADASVARRLLALALILDGHKRADAAWAAGMDRQTLRDWVHRYNAGGLAGLGDRHGGGAQPRLSPKQKAEVANWIRTGPDVEMDGVVRWRCVDIQARIAREWGVALHERSIGKSGKALALPRLHRLRFARVSTPTQGGRYGASVFRVGFTALLTAALPEAVRAAKTPIELWHQDEARVGQQGTPTYVWADKGSRRARRRRAGRCGLAPDRRAPASARQHQPAPTAAVFAGTEPAGKHVAIPAAKPAFKPCVRQLRRQRRGVLHRLERPHGHARSPHTC